MGFSGTGSNPPLFILLHLKIRHMVSPTAAKKLCFIKASIEYTLQDGVNIQPALKGTDINLL